MGRRRKRSRATRRGTSHRRPPRPASWDCPRGWCRFCGEPIIEGDKQNRRKHWHQVCADIWTVMNQPVMARRHVFLREKGRCQGEGCEFLSPSMSNFHVDHIRPLFEADGDLSYFHPDNLQLLCHACHGVKTRSDMERYYEGKRSGT